MAVDEPAVAADRRWLAGTVVLEVAQELRRGLVDRDAGAHEAGERALARLVEDVAQPLLGLALRVVAGWRPTALGPRRADLALQLATVGEAVLGVPDSTATALDAEDVATWIARPKGPGPLHSGLS